MPLPDPRPPTPAQTKVSPLGQLSEGNLYPYWDVRQSGITPYLNMIRRTFGALNPFSHQQVPTSERIGVGIRNGPTSHYDHPYPHGIHFDKWYPSHYNPLKDTEFKNSSYVKKGVPPGSKLGIGFHDTCPRFCRRTFTIYERCLMSNDNRVDVCQEEQNNTMSVCPTFALDTIRQNKLLLKKLQAMSNKKYHDVMSIPDYNKGRTVADVPLKSWQDGTKQHLRPNTLWADDRYVDVTRQQVLAARERVKKRREAQNVKLNGLPKYDRAYQVPDTKIPLYS